MPRLYLGDFVVTANRARTSIEISSLAGRLPNAECRPPFSAALDFSQHYSAFWQSKNSMRLRVPSGRLLSVLDTAIGTLLCASVALILALVFNQERLQLALPLICIAVVLAVAARFGVATGVLGSIVSALLLAYFVYAPVHSLRIASSDARASISWLLLGGISLSFLFTPRRDESKQRERNRTED